MAWIKFPSDSKRPRASALLLQHRPVESSNTARAHSRSNTDRLSVGAHRKLDVQALHGLGGRLGQ